MARLVSTRKDLNRFAKVYPYVRYPPSYVWESNIKPGNPVEAGKITINDTSTGIFTFVEIYTTVPTVVASAFDSAGNGLTNVSLAITSISLTSVTIVASSTFTGEVHVHILEV